MTDREFPSMEPLAPLVDQLIEIAEEEIPAPRTCRIKLYDDHTYRVYIEHHRSDGDEAIVYDRDSGEVYWRDTAGARTMCMRDPDDGHIITYPYFEDDAERVVTTIEPPIEARGNLKRYFVLWENDEDTSVYSGACPQSAAMKAASRLELASSEDDAKSNPSELRLREEGTDKVHVYDAWIWEGPAPDDGLDQLDDTVIQADVSKQGVEYIRL